MCVRACVCVYRFLCFDVPPAYGVPLLNLMLLNLLGRLSHMQLFSAEEVIVNLDAQNIHDFDAVLYFQLVCRTHQVVLFHGRSVCMCVSMYVYIYTCIYIYVCVCVFICIHTYVCIV